MFTPHVLRFAKQMATESARSPKGFLATSPEVSRGLAESIGTKPFKLLTPKQVVGFKENNPHHEAYYDPKANTPSYTLPMFDNYQSAMIYSLAVHPRSPSEPVAIVQVNYNRDKYALVRANPAYVEETLDEEIRFHLAREGLINYHQTNNIRLSMEPTNFFHLNLNHERPLIIWTPDNRFQEYAAGRDGQLRALIEEAGPKDAQLVPRPNFS